jgi:hypothetical protein
MVHARINRSQVEVQGPIPAAWEGQTVKLVALSPDDPVPDLEERLLALHALGPMEFELGERQAIASLLDDMNRLSKEAMDSLSGHS